MQKKKKFLKHFIIKKKYFKLRKKNIKNIVLQTIIKYYIF